MWGATAHGVPVATPSIPPRLWRMIEGQTLAIRPNNANLRRLVAPPIPWVSCASEGQVRAPSRSFRECGTARGAYTRCAPCCFFPALWRPWEQHSASPREVRFSACHSTRRYSSASTHLTSQAKGFVCSVLLKVRSPSCNIPSRTRRDGPSCSQ